MLHSREEDMFARSILVSRREILVLYVYICIYTYICIHNTIPEAIKNYNLYYFSLVC